jgi:hypothetical protein
VLHATHRYLGAAVLTAALSICSGVSPALAQLQGTRTPPPPPPQPAAAQPAPPAPAAPAPDGSPAPAPVIRGAGLGFEMGMRSWALTDARLTQGTSIFRLNFHADPRLLLFMHRENGAVSFKNSGTGAVPVTGTTAVEGVGVAYLFRDAFRLEIMMGNGSVNINDGALASSDPVTDLGFFYTYRGTTAAFIDLGLAVRTHKLSGAAAGNVVDASGTSQAKKVDDLGGTTLQLAIGFSF